MVETIHLSKTLKIMYFDSLLFLGYFYIIKFYILTNDNFIKNDQN